MARHHLVRICWKVLHGNERFLAGVSSWSSRRSLLAIGREVKRDEQDKIGRQDAHAGKGSKFLTRAGARIRCPGEVGAGEVGVGCEVDENEVDDELNDLEHGDVFLPPDSNSSSGLEVVPNSISIRSAECSDFLYQYMTTCTVKLSVIGTHETDVLPTNWV